MSCCERCRALEERTRTLARERDLAREQKAAAEADRDATRAQLAALQRMTAQRRLGF